ncbi:hypothetical protein [Flavisolibacter tropicus]|uniref:Cadherin domain-containing protein n=1 Tax=Flavisolibacter tropicus TaxID=1492898 RepID=A0A172U1W7_9BACT|nr:hypothetical protein [Flavisolibacter tropicus]ANE53246.1 hypothetical protein SY85_01150 [Flavisolibacter tropicus]
MKKSLICLLLILGSLVSFCQYSDTVTTLKTDTSYNSVFHPDSALRIIDLNPYFTLHVDSSMNYQLQINKNPSNYFWYLKNAPVGLRINKDNGILSFRADKAYFLSGKLKYDVNYKIIVGVQNLNDPTEKIDTSFSLVFYSTEIIPSRVKPAINGSFLIDEGESVKFSVFCETGSFPIESIITSVSDPINNYTSVQKCGDQFSWTPGYDFARETDPNKQREIIVQFIGSTKFQNRDTANVRIIVRNALDYPMAIEEHKQTSKNIERYVLQLKYTFLQLDKRLKRTKNYRTSFDLTSASTSLTGTVLSTSASKTDQRNGKILPSVGLALVPIKEASVPNKAVDQNQASLIRTSIKRLEYVLFDNQLLGSKDPDIIKKVTKLKEELKQIQIQLIDVPVELTNNFTEEELNRYFNSPKVTKKYRLKS